MQKHILQLTDFHIFADPESRFFGVPTRNTLNDVLQAIKAMDLDFDYVIITGDLTSDEQKNSYQTVKKILGDLIPLCKIIPGNHDDRALIREVFPNCIAGDGDSINFSVTSCGWRLLGLDTHVPGKLYGLISSKTLQWLDVTLNKYKNEPTILFQHHPPIPVGTNWVDKLALKNPDPLVDLLSHYPQVQVISCGHVHQEFHENLGNMVVLTTPSTSVQFKHGTDTLVCDDVPPGFRIFTLDGDKWETEVVWLDKLKYPPILNQQ